MGILWFLMNFLNLRKPVKKTHVAAEQEKKTGEFTVNMQYCESCLHLLKLTTTKIKHPRKHFNVNIINI